MNLDLITSSIQTTLESFDFGFCISVNVLTYVIIKTLDELNGDVKVSTWTKRIALLASIIVVSVVYYVAGIELKLLVNSAILAPVFWSWILKPICKKFKIDYKNIHIVD